MSAACQASVEAFVSGAQQQLPALAQGLHPHQLQDFLCHMHTQTQVVGDSRDGAADSVVKVRFTSRAGQDQYCLVLCSAD